MRLLKEIAELAVNSSEPLSNILRKCMVLNATLKNPELKRWIQLELNGYDRPEDLPDYRVISTQALGHFSGPMGAQIKNATLPPSLLSEKLRHWATTAYLMQPIASYDYLVQSGNHKTLEIPWPQDLVLYHQSVFYKGYALAQAWQQLPMSAVIALCDTIRNRVIEFALEIDETLSGYGDDIKELSPEEVQRSVVTIIYGDNNFVSGNARDIVNQSYNRISKNDIEALSHAIKNIGFSDDDVVGLRQALSKDKADGHNDKMGPSTADWLSQATVKISQGGMKVGSDIAVATLAGAIMKYLGLS